MQQQTWCQFAKNLEKTTQGGDGKEKHLYESAFSERL